MPPAAAHIARALPVAGERSRDASTRRRARRREDTGDLEEGVYASLFKHYVEAPREAGANRTPIDDFLARLRAGAELPEALAAAGIPEPSRRFVRATFGFITTGSLPAIAASFALGREGPVPELLRSLLLDLALRFPGRIDRFRDYLDRQAGLDRRHAALDLRILSLVCAGEPARWAEAEAAARRSLEARLGLWDGIAEALK